MPINRLPVELLQELFRTFEEDYGTLKSMGAICRHWRVIYITTPEFWTDLRVHLGVPLTTYSMAVERLDTMIARTGSMKVSVSLHRQLGGINSPGNAQLVARLIAGIPVERWKSLQLGSWYYGLDFVLAKGGVFSSLEVLEVDSYNNSSVSCLQNINLGHHRLSTLIMSGTTKLDRHFATIEAKLMARSDLVGRGTLVIICNTAPRVVYPQIQRLSVKIATSRAPTRWTVQPLIIELDLMVPSISNLNLSTLFPRLERLTIHIPTISDPYLPEDLLFPHLRYLTCKAPNYSCLAAFIAPELETLSLQGNNSLSQSQLEQALEDPRFQLSPQKLLINDNFDFMALSHILSLCPRISHLSVYVLPNGHIVDWTPLISLLQRQLTMQGLGHKIKWELCPHLESLEVMIEWNQSLGDARMTKFRVDTIMNGPRSKVLRSMVVRWKDGSVFKVEKHNII
ncbi:hypothetical protein FRC17_001675 [Serendipita sp. 399]|nr:hypothetical protein FRC17_001675 [Serendipita sp. 399]